MIPFITSKQGKLETISVFRYRFTDYLKRNEEQFQKFQKWISRNQDIILFEMDNEGFSSFLPMNDEFTRQYELIKRKEITAPFSNTQKISLFIGNILRSLFSNNYRQYLNSNCFITEEIDFYPFLLKKCIEFNIEVFTDGIFLVHFLPVSKITSSEVASSTYIRNLKTKFKNEIDSLLVTVVDQKNFAKQKINLSSSEDMCSLDEFVTNHENSIFTFDYHFLASYSSAIFRKITENTIKDLDQSVAYVEKIISSLQFPEWFNVQPKPFSRVTTHEFGNLANLRVGENKCVNKQSAAFYTGIYRPAGGGIIQPILIDSFQESPTFNDLIHKFNKGSNDFLVQTPIRLLSDETPDLTGVFEQKKERINQKMLACIFTQYELSTEFLSIFRKKRISYQIYQGSIDNFKLSNFTIKSLEKLGGILCTINQTDENENAYFMGIDLGHKSKNNQSFTNLGIAFFDNKGILLKHYVNKNIKKDESISREGIAPAFSTFINFLKKHNKPLPQKLIIHRDGKLHSGDIECLAQVAGENFSIENMDVLEIVKNGFPIIAGFETKDGAYCNLDSGSCWIDDVHKYAILVTNIQSDEKNALVKPLIIKHRYGNSDFKKLVKQIYWFTKIYTNNLYNSTRLPATTQKANNLAGTGKSHQATYLG